VGVWRSFKKAQVGAVCRIIERIYKEYCASSLAIQDVRSCPNGKFMQIEKEEGIKVNFHESIHIVIKK